MQTKEDFPLMLRAQHVAEILDVSERIAYEVMDYKDFPLVRVGRSKRVSRDAFFNWLDNRTNKSAM